jgi:hypothetical protein
VRRPASSGNASTIRAGVRSGRYGPGLVQEVQHGPGHEVASLPRQVEDLPADPTRRARRSSAPPTRRSRRRGAGARPPGHGSSPRSSRQIRSSADAAEGRSNQTGLTRREPPRPHSTAGEVSAVRGSHGNVSHAQRARRGPEFRGTPSHARRKGSRRPKTPRPPLPPQSACRFNALSVIVPVRSTRLGRSRSTVSRMSAQCRHRSSPAVLAALGEAGAAPCRRDVRITISGPFQQVDSVGDVRPNASEVLDAILTVRCGKRSLLQPSCNPGRADTVAPRSSVR